ncbi:hypothetical protein [Brevibacillus fluminis]|uniref:hypothetical protein n=1 Tax=Brevibacillus fluminis TaxID=511487 RepID=UPI001605F1C0|nr:hypothetical protein [Brevibacillus fluminis]
MFNAGDHVVFVLDGAVGVVLNVDGGRVQVLWEDHFVSWEKAELLRLLEEKQA